MRRLTQGRQSHTEWKRIPSCPNVTSSQPIRLIDSSGRQVLVAVTLLTLERALHARKHDCSLAMTHSTSGGGAT